MIYILGPAALMIAMAVVQLHLLRLVIQRPWAAQPVWMIASPSLIGVFSLLRRRSLSGGWFFFWGSLLAVMAILATYLSANLSGVIPMGGHDEFPGAIIMLPTIALLLSISLGALVIGLVTRWRNKS